MTPDELCCEKYFPRIRVSSDRFAHLAEIVSRQRLRASEFFFGGRVCSIGADYVLLEGISKFATIGELLSKDLGDEYVAVGSVVRIEAELTRVLVVDPQALRLGEFLYLRGPPKIFPDSSWCGVLIDALGRPRSGAPALKKGSLASVVTHANLCRTPDVISWPALRTGVRAIDLFAPLCAGQRIGVFAGSGVGKSTLLNMMMSRAACDVAVIALVGERGREVTDFIAHSTPEMLAKSVCVVATSDESALMRYLAPLTAMTVAEYFRQQGKKVLLVVDSLTRFAHALREILLTGGAPPVARGFPAAVPGHMARLLERAGPGGDSGGSITGVFSVLVDGDDHNDPISDAARGFLDGHIVLDRSIAERPQYPPVDILKSISRLASRALSPREMALAVQARKLVSSFEDTRDLRAIGAYQRGNDAFADAAIEIVPRLYDFLNETPESPRDDEPFAGLARVLGVAAAAP